MWERIVWLLKRFNEIPKIIYNRIHLYVFGIKNRKLRIKWLAGLTGRPEKEIDSLVYEIESDREFIGKITNAFKMYTFYFPLRTDFFCSKSGANMFFNPVSLYALVRIMKPGIIVETGGTPGKSSAFILRALQKNEKGFLYTLDLPPDEVEGRFPVGECHGKRPKGTRSNWAVPLELQELQKLVLGDSKKTLPELMNKLGEIDFFIHDSDHSYESMLFEFRQGWKNIRSGGFLWSDDVHANLALNDFCEEAKVSHSTFLHVAAIKKSSSE